MKLGPNDKFVVVIILAMASYVTGQHWAITAGLISVACALANFS